MAVSPAGRAFFDEFSNCSSLKRIQFENRRDNTIEAHFLCWQDDDENDVFLGENNAINAFLTPNCSHPVYHDLTRLLLWAISFGAFIALCRLLRCKSQWLSKTERLETTMGNYESTLWDDLHACCFLKRSSASCCLHWWQVVNRLKVILRFLIVWKILKIVAQEEHLSKVRLQLGNNADIRASKLRITTFYCVKWRFLNCHQKVQRSLNFCDCFSVAFSVAEQRSY